MQAELRAATEASNAAAISVVALQEGKSVLQQVIQQHMPLYSNQCVAHSCCQSALIFSVLSFSIQSPTNIYKDICCLKELDNALESMASARQREQQMLSHHTQVRLCALCPASNIPVRLRN